MFSKIKIPILVAVLVLLSLATPALSAADPVIELPTSAKIDARDDYAAGVFSQLLGPAWTFVAGENAVFGSIGQYSGLILAILQCFNFLGITAASALIIYQWGVFAVATAHEGNKLGGSMYNSLWTPLRSVFGFSLCVPVLHGLSLLQVAVIATIGLGINAGNVILTSATTYITQHVAAGASTDIQSQIIDSEALEVIQPLFQGVMLQEVFLQESKYHGQEPAWSIVREYREPRPVADWSTVEIHGNYVVEHRPLQGQAVLWIRTLRGADLGTFGGVTIPMPTAVLKNGKVIPGDNPAVYNAAHAIGQARLSALIEMADALRPWARYHLGTGYDVKNIPPRPSGDGYTIAEAYRQKVSTAAAAQIEESGTGKKVGEKMREAIGAAEGQTPAGGWIGAGVLPTILSYASRDADILSYGGGVRPVVVDASSGVYSTEDGVWSRFTGWWTDKLGIPEVIVGRLKSGPRFATQELLGGRTWSGHDAEGDSAGIVNRAVAYMFTSDNGDNGGVLAAVMHDFQTMNPLAALLSFGEKCLKICGLFMGVSAAAGLASAIPGLPGAIAGLVNNGLFISAIAGLGLVGILCTFVAPLTPLLIWCRGVLGWIIHAILALFGAPLLCIATIFPEGAGLAGQHARKGYVQLLDIAIRPAIMTACLCAAYVVLQVWALLLGALFSKFANASSAYATTGVIWQVGMSVMFVILMYSAIHLLFKYLVLTGPQSIMTWIGGVGMSLGAVEKTADRDTTVVGGVIGKGSSGLAGTGSALGGAAKDFKKEQGGGKGGGGGPKADLPTAIAPKTDEK